MYKVFIFTIVCISLLPACNSKKPEQSATTDSPITVTSAPFGITAKGDSVTLFSFKSSDGFEVRIMNYGGIVTHLMVPDKNGRVEDVVLGFDDLESYLTKQPPYFGAIVGRYGNRIAAGKFSLNGVEYPLVQNNGANHLHGGIKGFDKVVWEAESFTGDSEAGLRLKYLSEDMEEGYPGNLDVEVIYTIRPGHEVQIDYYATTDKPTIVNLTQHSYFNLTGNARRDIQDHEVMIRANDIVPVDAGLIPTGVLMPVAGTPFDFNTTTPVGSRIDDDHEQLQLGGGYDHCWVLNKSHQGALDWVITAIDAQSGRVLELATTEPGVQLYTGNFLDGSLVGKGGVSYQHRFGLCFEPQHFPDSPNQPDFPSVVLNPGEEYKSTTVWRFSVQE